MTDLLVDSLFERVLLAPASNGADQLLVVSGYASPAMAWRHMSEVKRLTGRVISLELVVGMTGLDGLPIGTHMGFQGIASQIDPAQFSCSYVQTGTSVHSKVYVWMRRGRPVEAWVGSANYTQNGFGLGARGARHSEVMTPTAPDEALEYFDSVWRETVPCHADDVDSRIVLHAPGDFVGTQEAATGDVVLGPLDRLENRRLPLFITSGPNAGQVHGSSGLNWGQRTVDGRPRESNQAYIPVPAYVARSGFFPPRGVHFNLATTDGRSMLMTAAQDGAKALESTQDNSIVGRYFRDRLGIKNGQRVTIEDLDRFGNRYVTVFKISDSEYILDYRQGTSS